VFQPAGDAAKGKAVRSGDRLGVVEVLGVPHEVLAPADGVVGETLVEAGHAVEYGQELVRLELAATEAAG
jgi:biotin carboxyl carrier protein